MIKPIYIIARFSLLEAVRGKIIWSVVGLLMVAFALAFFISQTSLTETRESEVALMSGLMRLASVIIIIFFVIASIARDFQDKSIELLFAVNISRYQVFLGKFLGFSLLAFIISLILSPALFFYADAYAVLIWSISLWCELTLVALISLLFILTLENVALSLIASFSVYSLMRFMPAIQSMGEGPFQDGLFNQVMNGLIDIVDLILPRLEHFSQSSWLVYQPPAISDLMGFVVEFILFTSLFILVGVIELKRKSI